MTETLRIHLLGPFTIDLDGVPVASQDWRSQQTQTIAKILLARRGEVVKTDQLMDLLWPTDPAETARSRLHVRISQLRSVLHEKKELLKTVHGGYLFQPDETCWLDVDAFQSQITEAAACQENGQPRRAIQAYEKARQFYRGDFLAEDLYADWTYHKREFYREAFLSLLVELSECYAQQGRYRLAIARARQALEQDSLRETIYVRLMLYHYYAGERSQALRAYERCQEVLQTELGVRPLESTRHLLNQIKTGTLWKNTDAPRYPPPIYEGRLFEVPYSLNEIPFVNREREYAWLVSQWKDETQRVILLEGEAGIGKSRLVEAFVGYIASQGARIIHARLSLSARVPAFAVAEALQGLLTNTTLSRLSPETLAVLAILFPDLEKRVANLPDLPELSPDGERRRLHQSIAALAAACPPQPTLIVVDDAHRLSADAVDLLAHLGETFRVLLSYRGEETPPAHPLRKAFGSASWHLQPLPQPAIADLIQTLSGQTLPTIAEQVSVQSEGNPLFAVTLLQHMFETGLLFVGSGGSWEVTEQTSPTLPPTLRRTIETRLQRLNRTQRRILDYAAVIGGEFDFNLLRTASQDDEESLLTTLDELMDAALLIEPRSLNSPEFMIHHDRTTEVAYETIPSVRRKGMHLQVARAMEKLHAGQLDHYAPALADHYDKAEEIKSAAHYAAQAGEQAAARFATSEARHYLGRALALLPIDDHAQRARLLLVREQVYDLLGLRQEQNEDLSTLAAISHVLTPEQQAEIHLRSAGYEWLMGNDDNSNAALNKALQTARSCKAVEIEARALLLAGRAALDQNEALKHLNRARNLAQAVKQRPLEGDIVRCLGNAHFWQNQYTESQALFEEALAIHREVGDLRGELSALNNLAHVLELFGDLQKSVQCYQKAQKICENIADRLAEGVILTNLGGLTAQMGHFQEAQGWLERAVDIRHQIGNEEGKALALHNLGNVSRQQGLYAQSLMHYQEALAINQRIKHVEQTGETLNALSVLYRELGDYKRAQTYLADALTYLPAEDSRRHIRTLIDASLLYHLQGDQAKALLMGEQALAQCKTMPPLFAAALKNTGFALGQKDESRENFRQARRVYNDLSQPHLATEPAAGLAWLSYQDGDLPQALTYTEEILEQMEGKPLQGPDRVLWIYLVCYRVLTQAGDDRAESVLASAHTLMNDRAARIGDEVLRQTYLESVAENVELARFWDLGISH